MLLHEEEDEDDEEGGEESVKSCLPVFHTWCDIFILFFAYSYFFNMFSTLMSLKDRLRLKLKVKTLCMAILLDNPWQSLYTQYGMCDE